MSYIGNTQNNQNYVPAIDYFNGNGSTTAFTLSRPVASVAAVQAVINNVPQNPGDAFTVSGSTITFTSAPPSGTNNIYVYYTSPNTQVVQPGQGTVGTTQLQSDLTLTNPTYTGTLTGGTGVVNIGSGQVYKDSSGNVGIGTSSPVRKLHVSGGSAQIDYDYGNSGTSFRILNDATPSNGVTLNAEFYGSGSYGPMKFWTGNAERMRIDSSGNLLVGITSFGSASDSSNPSNTAGLGLSSQTAGGVLNLKLAGTNGTIVNFSRGGIGIVGHIDVTTTATSYVTSSDYRLKENVQPMQNALGVVAQLNPVTYTWKADGSDGQGFIAHELQAVVPDCVTGEKDAVDAEGNPVYQGIDTSFLVATLTKAIQELNEKVEAQAAEIAALKGAA